LYDALKKAQQARAALGRSKKGPPAPLGFPGPERRRSARWELGVNVLVYGRTTTGAPFCEQTRTLQVSDTGCLVKLSTPVTAGQRLIIIRQSHDSHCQAQVVRQIAGESHGTEAGVEFLETVPDFWSGGELLDQ
jgi:hypothetical protein